MKDEHPIAKVMVKPIIQKNPNKESISKNEEEKRESFKIKDPSNPKVTKIQEKNINDNYGRIYIQEGQRNNPNYVKNPQAETKYRGYQNKNPPKTYVYTKINNIPNNKYNNNNYSDRVDITKLNFNKDRDGPSKKNNLRRKSIDRGEKNNVQITHIINSSMDIDFHITDPLAITTEESRRKYRGSIDKKNRNGKKGNVKVTYSSSCDKVKIIPKKKIKNPGTIEYVKHRENPHLKRIDNNIKNSNNYSYRDNNNIKMSNIKVAYPANKNQRKYNN
jgi:hypothetical protein